MKAFVAYIAFLGLMVIFSTIPLVSGQIESYVKQVEEEINSGTDKYLDDLQSNIVSQIEQIVQPSNMVESFYDEVESEINNGTEQFLKDNPELKNPISPFP